MSISILINTCLRILISEGKERKNMAECLRSKFHEHLSCAICLEQLEDPKVLPCLHSYCYKCIAELDMTGNILNCPECRTTVEVPDPPDVSFLPSNFFAKNLLATLLLSAESDSKNIVCDNCDSGEQPETRCQQCTRYLCKFCTESHRRSRDTKTHTLSTLDELRESKSPVIAETIRCLKHEDEIIKLYCKTCQETICRDCTIVDHRQHDYVFARDVCQEKKDELLRLVEEVKQKRSEMSESLAYLRKMEENVQESNESTVKEINEYFEILSSVVKSEKGGFLEEAGSVKCAKLKQLHLQQEELELSLGSCNSSIEFTEKAFENGNDVQILNLTKYMTRCLGNLKDRKTEIHPLSDYQLAESTTKLIEHANLCDRMVQLSFVNGNNTKLTDTYTVTFNQPSECLLVDENSEIRVQRKDSSTEQGNGGKITISPCFEGVAVRDVTIVDNDDGSRTVRFCPIHVGELRFVAYMNGSPVTDCVVAKTVKKKNEVPKDCHIGNRIFESGIHTWEIEIDHSDCDWNQRVDFSVGVIDYTHYKVVAFKGFVKPDDFESVDVTLNMKEQKLMFDPSWQSNRSYKSKKVFPRVCPYFSSDCDQCKLTVSGNDWCFVKYQ